MFSPQAPQQQPQPKPPDPIRIPQTDDPDVAQSIRRKMQEQFALKNGRAAADLTSGTPQADKGAYSRSQLG